MGAKGGATTGRGGAAARPRQAGAGFAARGAFKAGAKPRRDPLGGAARNPPAWARPGVWAMSARRPARGASARPAPRAWTRRPRGKSSAIGGVSPPPIARLRAGFPNSRAKPGALFSKARNGARLFAATTAISARGAIGPSAAVLGRRRGARAAGSAIGAATRIRIGIGVRTASRLMSAKARAVGRIGAANRASGPGVGARPDPSSPPDGRRRGFLGASPRPGAAGPLRAGRILLTKIVSRKAPKTEAPIPGSAFDRQARPDPSGRRGCSMRRGRPKTSRRRGPTGKPAWLAPPCRLERTRPFRRPRNRAALRPRRQGSLSPLCPRLCARRRFLPPPAPFPPRA